MPKLLYRYLSFDIQRAFKKFCEAVSPNDKSKGAISLSGNISGGVTIHHPKFPLYQMAKLSGEAEHKAKTDEKGKKNRISLLYDTVKDQKRLQLQKDKYMLSMTWKNADDYLIPMMQDFIKLGKLDSQPNGREVFVLGKISSQTIEKWFQVVEQFYQKGEMYISTMARVMMDVRYTLNLLNSGQLFSRLLPYLYQQKNPNMCHFHIPLNWLSFLRRTR